MSISSKYYIIDYGESVNISMEFVTKSVMLSSNICIFCRKKLSHIMPEINFKSAETQIYVFSDDTPCRAGT